MCKINLCKMQNIWNTQRAIRVGVWLWILTLACVYKSKWGFVGLIPLATWIVWICPMCYLWKSKICLIKDHSKDTKKSKCVGDSCEDELE